MSDWVELLNKLTANPTAAIALGSLGRTHRRDASGGSWLIADKRGRYEDQASTWFVVDLDHVPGDPADADAALVDYIGECMPELSCCAFVAAFTSSAGIKGSRLRLVFELKEPRTLAAMRAYALAVNARAGCEVIDASVYTAGHLVLTAAPRLFAQVANGDALRVQALPRPVRTHAWHVAGDLASIPDVPVTNVTAAPYVPSVQRSEGLSKSAAAELLQTLGPGNYNANVHKWLCHVAWRTPDHRAESAFAEAVSAIQDRIRETSEAEKLSERLRIHGNASALRRKWDTARERRRATLQPGIGASPVPIATTTQANIDGFAGVNVSTAGAHDLGAPPAAATSSEAAQPKSIAEIRLQLAADVCTEGAAIIGGKQRHVLFTHAPGTGKTTALLALLTAGRLSSDLTRIRVPTHKLGEELVTKLKAHALTLAPGGQHYGVDLVSAIRHHKGRAQPGMCPDADSKSKADLAESLGVSVKKNVCANCATGKAGLCPWLNQEDDTAPGVIVEAHHAALAAGGRPAQLVIYDEGTIAATIQTGADSVPIAELVKTATIFAVRQDNGLGSPLRAATLDLNGYRGDLVRSLRSSVPNKEGAAGKLLTASIGALVSENKFEARKGKRREQRTGTGAAHAIELEKQLQATLYARIANPKTANDKRAEAVAILRVSQAATRLYQAIDASAGRAYVFGVATYFQGRGKSRVDRVKCLTRGAEPSGEASISFDGTADVGVWRALVSPTGATFEERIHGAEPEISAGALAVLRYGDKTGARSSLVPEDIPSAAELDAVEKRDWLSKLPPWAITSGAVDNPAGQLALADAVVDALQAVRKTRKKRSDSSLDLLWRFVLFEAARHLPRAAAVNGQPVSVLLVAQNAVLEHLRGLGLPSNVAPVHFGALRGLDGYRDVPCCIVIGRPRPSDIDLELMTEALHSHDLAVTEIMRQQPGQWIEAHPDARVSAVQAVTAAAEVKQAVARIRPYDRTPAKPCTVHVFGVYDTGLPEELVQLRSWADADRSPAEVALAYGAVFSDARLNQRAYGSLFPRGNARASGRTDLEQAAKFRELVANLARGLARQHVSAVAGEVGRECTLKPYKERRGSEDSASLLGIESTFAKTSVGADALAYAADGSDTEPGRQHRLVKLRTPASRKASLALIDARWGKVDVERRLGCEVTAWRELGAQGY